VAVEMSGAAQVAEMTALVGLPVSRH